ncbi:MAG: hypothetical protein JSW72_08285 [Candidatus Bathyarchaeota archaeon]|nr:MAG: hypothetical protein JSW72_08285 [Candidatus Bathyarchaeota archaeon]
MMTEDLVVTVDHPHFIVKLYRNRLEVDLKEGIKKKLEKAIEANPVLKGSFGFLAQTIIPIDVGLKDVESVELDGKKRVKVVIPHRKDITIPVEPGKSEKLIRKMRELIQIEKQKERKRMLALEKSKLVRRLATASIEQQESEKIVSQRKI